LSKLSTTPVVKCVHCGRPVTISSLQTNVSDEDGKLLMQLFKGIAENALCYRCQQEYNYLAKEGRLNEWHTNQNPLKDLL
jgi:hypothetical protein